MWLPSTIVVSVTVYSPTSSATGTVNSPFASTVVFATTTVPSLLVMLYVTCVAFSLATVTVISSPYTFSTSSAFTLDGAGVIVIFEELVLIL